MPAFLIHRILSPSRSRSLVPSLAPSWFGPCPTLRLVLMTTSSCAPWGPSAFIWTGLGLCLLRAIAYLCRLVTLLALCPKMLSPFFCARSSMPLGQLGLRWAPLGPMRSAASLPRSLSTATGRFPQCLSQPLGAPVQCSPLVIYATFSTNMMACFPWVLSWLRVRGLVSPHLFLFALGEEEVLIGPCLRFRVALTTFLWLDVGPAHPATGRMLGCTLFVFTYDFFYLFLFLLFICIPRVPALLFRGVFMRGVAWHNEWLGCLGVPLLALPGLCLLLAYGSRQLAPVASSDRHSVAVALSSSL